MKCRLLFIVLKPRFNQPMCISLALLLNMNYRFKSSLHFLTN